MKRQKGGERFKASEGSGIGVLGMAGAEWLKFPGCRPMAKGVRLKAKG